MSKHTKTKKKKKESILSSWFALEKEPRKGLLTFEGIMILYLVATLVMILLLYGKIPNPQPMIWGRMRILTMTLALWGVYRMLPCRAMILIRATLQMVLLSWWYPDTYELNRALPNLDHVFATLEQNIFGCQPALLFSQYFDSGFFSELMCLGYSCYYPMMVVVALFYAVYRKQEFERVVVILMGAFFVHYVIFVLVPVTGPQFYYCAVGEDQIAAGVFPNLHHYFLDHQECLPCPGYENGFFYHLVEAAHQSGERPTAAFPSSHVSICLISLLLAWHSRCKVFFYILIPFAVLLFFSTVYIKAHYAIDALAGLVSGVVVYAFFRYLTRRMVIHPVTHE
jgi:membrane-associated phospholipid phosphatase